MERVKAGDWLKSEGGSGGVYCVSEQQERRARDAQGKVDIFVAIMERFSGLGAVVIEQQRQRCIKGIELDGDFYHIKSIVDTYLDLHPDATPDSISEADWEVIQIRFNLLTQSQGSFNCRPDHFYFEGEERSEPLEDI